MRRWATARRFYFMSLPAHAKPHDGERVQCVLTVSLALLLKHQLLISNRSRQRTPNLITLDCFALGFF